MASKYLKNTITLLSGIGIGQVLSLASLPLLTRLYTSEQIGAYFFVFAIAGIASAILSLQSHLTIVRGRTVEEAYESLSYSLSINLVSHLLIMVVCGIVYVTPLMNSVLGKAGGMLFYAPVLSFLLSTQLSFDSYYNHQQAYNKLRGLKIARSAIMVGLQLLLPIVFFGDTHFLILGQIVGLAIVMIANWIELRPAIIVFHLSGWSRFWNDQKDVLVYNTGISFINTLSNQLPYLLLGHFFGSEIVAVYGLAQRLISTPLGLFGQSIGIVFYQKGTQAINHSKRLMPLFFKTLILLLKYGAIPSVILAIAAKTLFVRLFGNDWIMTGSVLQVILPWVFVMYVNSALSYTLSLLQIQKRMIAYEFLLITCRILSLISGFYLLKSALGGIVLLSVVGFAFNLYYFVKLVAFTNRYDKLLKPD